MAQFLFLFPTIRAVDVTEIKLVFPGVGGGLSLNTHTHTQRDKKCRVLLRDHKTASSTKHGTADTLHTRLHTLLH